MSFQRDKRVCDTCGASRPDGPNKMAPGWYFCHEVGDYHTYHMCVDCQQRLPKILKDVASNQFHTNQGYLTGV